MKDINDIMPKVPDMKWGALLNKKPTNKKIEELNNLLPHNGRWHTVYEAVSYTHLTLPTKA